MKRIFKSIYPIFLIAVFLGSCEKQLEKSPLDKFASETFWTSEANALLALNGVYRGTIQINNPEFNPTDWWSYNGLMFLEFATDNAYDRRGDNAATHKLTDGTNTATNAFILHYWERSYQKIARANDFLENIDNVPMDGGKTARFSAEARVIRACQYFYLAQYWGDVPLVTAPISTDEANTITRTAKAEVMGFVIDELSASLAALPVHADLPESERGRITQQAALAFLGRALLAEYRYADAAAAYKQIIDFGQNSIDPDYAALFNPNSENSDEHIFSTQYVENDASNAMFQHFFPAVRGGWHIFCPLGSLVEAYPFDDGTPFSYEDTRYDPNNIAAHRDPRLKASILFNGDLFGTARYVTHPDSTSSPDQLGAGKQTTQTGYGLRKMMQEDFSGQLANSGTNMPIIRYAEVLLGYLEAKLEAGDPINQALLDQTINQVRGRTSVALPPVTVTDPTQLRPILRNERRLELAFEGIRYWDLLRWKAAETVLNGDFYGAPYPTATRMRRKDNQDDAHDRWYVTTRRFRSATDYHWPVPQAERNINPNLGQNDGY